MNHPVPTAEPVPTAAQRPTLTIEETARYLDVSRTSAYRAAKAGEIPTISVGRRLLVPTAALRRLLALDAA